jgi:hypothetical protein
MKKHLATLTILLLAMYFPSGCILDPKETPKPPDTLGTVWPDLVEKNDIFEYLDLVYENMDINTFPKLLDEEFTFWFSQADYNDGITPEQWRKTAELASANNMFNNFSHPKYGSITGIDLEITPEGLWIEVPKTEPPFEGETWYQKTAEYFIIVSTTSEFTLQGQEKKALFTVRQSELEGETIYRIVQWNDDIQ